MNQDLRMIFDLTAALLMLSNEGRYALLGEEDRWYEVVAVVCVPIAVALFVQWLRNRKRRG